MEKDIEQIKDWQVKHEGSDKVEFKTLNDRADKIDATLIESRNIREEQHAEIMKMLKPLYKQYAFHTEVSEWGKKKLALIGKILGVLISAGIVWTAVKVWIMTHLTLK